MMMNNLSTYIIEKLHLDKNIKIKDSTRSDEVKKIIDDYLKEVTVDKYKVYFSDHEDELYIEIIFDQDQDNTQIHTWGLNIFNELYDEEKFKPYNRGTDWWISSAKKIVFSFKYK